MCVAAIAWDAHPEWLLVAIGNRDEFHDRPSAPLARWDDGSGIIAGRDLRAGGTWLGVTEAGRFALLTNFRDPAGPREGRPSRGGVVTDLLAGRQPADAAAMNPFNCAAATRHHARLLSNHPGLASERMAAGVSGLSNGPLGEPWPKTRQLCARLASWLAGPSAGIHGLFSALREETPAPTEPAPTEPAPAGLPQPDFSPVFIRHPVYGTRCSTVLTIGRDGAGLIAERSFDPAGKMTGEERIAFAWAG